jgi:hypothetical protein
MTRSAFTAIAALVVVGAAGLDIASAQIGPALPPRAGPGQITRPPGADAPTIAQATTSISCRQRDGSTITYTLSVDGGSCLAWGTGSNRQGRCISGADETKASCRSGCDNSEGSGSCTQTTTR